MRFSHAIVIASAAVLAACGGGGGSSNDAQAPAPAGPVTIAGTAATGAALAGAAVSVKCAAGTGTATTGGDGSYTVTIASASLPCAVQAAGGGKTFHAVVPSGSGTGPYVANITPLTEMLVAKLGGVSPASFFTAFSSGSAVSAASVTQAIDYLKLALAKATDLSGVNPLTDTLVVGNPLDLKLDALKTALAAAGLTVDQVNAAIVANPTTPGSVASAIAPVSVDCAWFKGGKYRMINPYETEARWRAHVVTIDVAAKTVTDQDNVVQSYTSLGGCQFSVDGTDFSNTVMVSSSGVLVVYSQSKTTASLRHATVGLPEQAVPLSEVAAGTWNLAGWDLAGATTAEGYLAITGEASFDTTGQMLAISRCLGLAACVAGTGPFAALTTNATGGFDILDRGVPAGRAFLYKNLAGQAVLVAVFDDGTLSVGSRKQALGALPAVSSTSSFHEFSLNGNNTVSTLVDHVNTVTATDPVARTVTRTREDGRVDTIGYDKPRDGLRYRAPNSCTNGGVAVNCSEVVQIPLQGMGITLALSVGTTAASAFFDVSVGKP